MKSLPKRSTRGKRMNQLIGEELEQDALFWNQDMFQEVNSDGEYATESEKADVFDDDFFKSEDESHDGPQDEDEGEEESEVQKESEIPRKRSRNKRRKAKAPDMSIFSQKEMLEQAAITEMFNSYSLSQLLKSEQCKKNDSNNKKSEAEISYRMKDRITQEEGRTVSIWTTESLELPSYEDNLEKRICKVTGKPAKYKDPLTGFYYSDLKAFKIIRENYYLQQEEPFKSRLKELKAKLKRLPLMK